MQVVGGGEDREWRVRKAERRMQEFKAQELANMAWAFATVDLSDELLFAVLAKVAQWQVGKCKAQNLANTAWAFATLDLSDELLFAALARVAA